MGQLARNMLQDLFSSEHAASKQLHHDREVMIRLQRAVDEFSVTMQRAKLSADIGDRLPMVLRVSRYYEEVADIALNMAHLQEGMAYVEEPNLTASMNQFRSECVALLAQLEPQGEEYDPLQVTQALQDLEQHYEKLKAQLLRAGAGERIRLPSMVAQLDLHSDLRRAMEQVVKGANHLHELADLASRYRQEETPPDAEEEKEI